MVCWTKPCVRTGMGFAAVGVRFFLRALLSTSGSSNENSFCLTNLSPKGGVVQFVRGHQGLLQKMLRPMKQIHPV